MDNFLLYVRFFCLKTVKNVKVKAEAFCTTYNTCQRNLRYIESMENCSQENQSDGNVELSLLVCMYICNAKIKITSYSSHTGINVKLSLLNRHSFVFFISDLPKYSSNLCFYSQIGIINNVEIKTKCFESFYLLSCVNIQS